MSHSLKAARHRGPTDTLQNRPIRQPSYSRRGAADRSEHRQAAGASTEGPSRRSLTHAKLALASPSRRADSASSKKCKSQACLSGRCAYQRHGASAVRTRQFGCVGCGHDEVAHDEVPGRGPGRRFDSRPGPGIAEQRGFPLGHSAAGRLFRCVCGFLMNATRPVLGSQAAQQG
jgi:hypothetical protein